MSEVVDLDILRPPPKKVVLAGKEIDVSFVPCAITWEVDRLVKQVYEISETELGNAADAAEAIKELANNGDATARLFDVTIELCATFCANQHPAMTVDWFKTKTDPAQVNKLSEIIIETLQRSFAGAEAYQGN